MRWGLLIALLVPLIVIGFGLYVRLAPSDPARWHVGAYPKPPGDRPAAGAFEAVRVIRADPDEALAQIDAIIRATPRTTHLAGSREEGMLTYITRSALWGFPDYTTVELIPANAEAEGAPTLTIRGRLRFGEGDMGVNAQRIGGWLAALPDGALQSPGE